MIANMIDIAKTDGSRGRQPPRRFLRVYRRENIQFSEASDRLTATDCN